MLKIGLIGAGFMGGMHSACYEALRDSGVKICAVADIDDEKAKAVAAKFDAEVYKTGNELIENADVDVVDICLPTYLHTEHAVKAMEKGRDIFIEKPVCLNLDEAKLLLEIGEKTGAKVMIGQCIRLWPEYIWLKETNESGEYGKIISAVFKRVSPKPTWAWENWLHKVECSGSVALDLHIHDVDYIRYLMGEPVSINSTAARDSEGVIQQIFTLYQYHDSVVAAEGAWDYPRLFPFCMEYRVKFEKATVVFDSGNNPALVVYPNEGGQIVPEIKYDFDDSNDIGGNISSLGGYYNELKYFVERLTLGLPLEVAPLSEGVKSLELVLREIEMAGGAKKQKKGISVMQCAAFATDQTNINVYIDNQLIQFEQAPVTINDRVFVPVRSIFERLGATLTWDESKQTVTAVRDTDKMVLKIGEKQAYINNQETVLEAPPQIINGRTMVPVRFLGESFNADVQWLEASQSIYIYTDAQANEELRKINSLYKDYYVYLANQWDPETGGFYFARSSIFNDQFKPDLESTGQALYPLGSALLSKMPKEIKDKIITFFQSRQDPETGYFYDPHNNMRENERQVNRSFTFVKLVLTLLEERPLHPLPGQNKEIALDKLDFNKVVVASDFQEGNTPENTLDGSFETRWSAEGDGQFIQYKLKETTDLEQIEIAFFLGNTRKYVLEVKTSTDLQNWKTVFSGESNGTTNELEIFPLEKTSAKYVRIVMHGNSENHWNNITQVSGLNLDPAEVAALKSEGASKKSDFDVSVLPEYYSSPQAYREWMEGLPWYIGLGSWYAFDRIQTSGSTNLMLMPIEIREQYVAELMDFVNKTQDPETGLWGKAEYSNLYIDVSGVLKLATLYDVLDLEVPNADKIVQKTLEALRNYKPTDIAALRNMISLLAAKSMRRSPLYQKAFGDELIELIKITSRNLEEFLRPDGGFSYHYGKANSISGGIMLGEGLVESEINGTHLAFITLKDLYDLLDRPFPPQQIIEYEKYFYPIMLAKKTTQDIIDPATLKDNKVLSPEQTTRYKVNI